MRLVENYSAVSRLRISNMEVSPQFLPLPFEDKYVLIVTSTGTMAKTYDQWGWVSKFVKEHLNKSGYKLIQAGGKDDYRVWNDGDLCGQTNFNQFAYLIQNASLIICGDTSSVHLAGHFNVPFVALYSSSSPDVSGAYFGDKSKQIYLTPENHHFNYVTQEHPKSINKILPETVIAAIGKQLGIEFPALKTLKIGAFCQIPMIDVIPDCFVGANFIPGQMVGIRYDKGGQENFIFQQLQQRKCTIVTDKPINVQILSQLRPQIERVVCIIDQQDNIQFLKELKLAAIPFAISSRDTLENINNKKLDYCEIGIIEKRSEPKAEDSFKNAKFRTNKRIVSSGKVYLTYAHLSVQKHIEDLSKDSDNVIDSEEFWNDLENYYIYE